MKEFQRIIIRIYTREKMCTGVTSDTPLRDVPEAGVRQCPGLVSNLFDDKQ